MNVTCQYEVDGKPCGKTTLFGNPYCRDHFAQPQPKKEESCAPPSQRS